MHISTRKYRINNITLTFNRVIWALCRIKVSQALVWGRIRDILIVLFLGIKRRISSPLGVSLAIPAVLVIAGPAVLYLHEHSTRIESDRMLSIVSTELNSENHFLKKATEELLSERLELYNMLLDAGYEVYTDNAIHIRVLATGYSSSPLETDDTPFITAHNTSTRRGIIALSRDLLRPYTPDAPFGFGDQVYLRGIGEFIVEDVMHGRWRKRADIWFPSRWEALHFGKRVSYLSKELDNLALVGAGSDFDNPSRNQSDPLPAASGQ